MKVNKKMNSKISSFVKCPQCNRIIEQRKIGLHEMMCSTARLRQSQRDMQKCNYCLAMIEKDQYDLHVKNLCLHREVPCIDCDEMFPHSLLAQHREVCQARKDNSMKEEKGETPSSAFGNLLTGLSYVGATIYNKGAWAAAYCGKFIQQNRSPALLYLQFIRAKIEDKFEDLFMNLAYEENVEGMPREQIRKLKLVNHKSKEPQPEACTICICEFQEQEAIKELKCKHIFHPTCIDKWLRINRTCPLCKMDQWQQQ